MRERERELKELNLNKEAIMGKAREAKLQAEKDIREYLATQGKSFIAISTRQWNAFMTTIMEK